MGTNYYLHSNICESCGRAEKLHIGKSSGGWAFALHVCPDEGISDFAKWNDLFQVPGNKIFDEYGRKISYEEMVDEILHRKHIHSIFSKEFLDQNHAVYDEKTCLLRCKVYDTHCIGHGAGTYDLIVGDFS